MFRWNQILINPLDRRGAAAVCVIYSVIFSSVPRNYTMMTFPRFRSENVEPGERRTRQLGQMLRVWLLFPPAHTCPTPPAPDWGGLWVTACPRVRCVHHLLRLSATPASSVIVDRPVWSSLFVHNSSSSLANPDKEAVRRLKMFRTFETNGIVELIDLNNLLKKRGTVSFQNR